MAQFEENEWRRRNLKTSNATVLELEGCGGLGFLDQGEKANPGVLFIGHGRGWDGVSAAESKSDPRRDKEIQMYLEGDKE